MNKEHWLFDFVEKELAAQTQFEMKRVIQSSAEDMEMVSSINALKKLIKHHDEVLEPSEAHLRKIHNNVMEVILQGSSLSNESKIIPMASRSIKSPSLHLL